MYKFKMGDGVDKAERSGRVIFWGGGYGFIQTSDGDAVFFHNKSKVPTGIKRFRLLDEVTFTLSKSTEGKYKNRSVATNINITQRGTLSDYKRYVGRLINWDGDKGFIESPQQEKKVLFFKSRMLYPDDSLTDGDYLVFHQVKSSNSPDQLFALFAYSLQRESNLVFLRQQYVDSQLEPILDHIKQRIREFPKLSHGARFKLEFLKIGYVDNHSSYLSLVKKLEEYKNLGFHATLQILKEYCSEVYLIQLWETGLIYEFDLNLIERYFYKASADKKRALITRFDEGFKARVLENYFESLKAEGKALGVNNNIKTLLDIVHRNPESRHEEIYQSVKGYILSTFKSAEIISLWLSGYIGTPPEDFILGNLDIDNLTNVKAFLSKKKPKVTEAIRGAIEGYLLSINTSKFEKELPRIVNRLSIFANSFPKQHGPLLLALGERCSAYQKFVLWILRTNIEFNAVEYFSNTDESINAFYKVLLFNHPSITNDSFDAIQLLDVAQVTQQGLLDFATSFEWDTLITPTISPSENGFNSFSFLDEIEKFINENCVQELDLGELAVEIYNSIPRYEVHHLRLWLYGWVEQHYYDYVGFRSKFSQLQPEEKVDFKKQGEDNTYQTDVVEFERQETEPCTVILSADEDSTLYDARLFNFYFENGSLRLRTQDGSYTSEWEEVMASSGLNRVPVTSQFNQSQIRVEVNADNCIIQIEGLTELFTFIHTGEIERTFGKIGESLSERRNSSKAYAEDWSARKLIIDYLNENQVPGVEPIYVQEPKNFFRRLDTNSGVDSMELTTLYTLDASDGKAIVWENSDFSEDRATYVFKSTDTDLDFKLHKIADAIVSIAQLRSALISNKEDPNLPVFRANLGFVGTIRKRRGKHYSFENWKEKLAEALSKPIIPIPSDDELVLLENWSPEIPHSPKIPHLPKTKVSPKKIRDSDIDYVKIGFSNEQQIKVKEEPIAESSRRNVSTGFSIGQQIKVREEPLPKFLKRNPLLESLKSFNNYFLQGLEL
ncbi:hypothetical protein TH61_16255 [Rufibacter sp. DG15C]|uniref:cold-shock protein n=1 Tax=Rufibacter sp. DG15C TaxID=1379909 RepID=UPI00078BC735|nr:cold shock domain-containing protein [Rufibacter sp. DG15C]AMM52429.1 hypothetical protein TH61_16255 [Rufibacter sp. DG15C]